MAHAMDVGDELAENNIPSSIRSSIETFKQGKVGSPEDIAWVDSCLIKEPYITDDNWNSLKAALLEILSSQLESFGSSSQVSNELHQETDTGIHSSHKESDMDHKFSSEQLVTKDENASTSDDVPISKDADDLHSFTFEGNPFLPGYSDDLGVSENLEFGVDMDSWTHETEPSTKDIFRVWNLEVPEDDHELVKQLHNAIEAGLPPPLSSSSPDSDAWKILEETSVDDIVAGIADLSLNQEAKKEEPNSCCTISRNMDQAYFTVVQPSV